MTTSNTTQIQKLKIKPLQEMLNLQTRKREDLLHPWLRQGDSAMIYAPTGCGKSIFALAVALAVAGGGEFLGWKSSTARRVLFVDGEMPEADITERCRMLLPTVQGCDAERAGQNLTFLARQAQHPDSHFPDLATPQGHDEIIKRACDGNVELLVLDNFSTLAECEDENSASAFNGIIRFLMRVKQAGVACILIHHSNKTGVNYRGSSKLATTFEVLMGLTPERDATARSTLAFNLAWAKYRGLKDKSVMGRSVRFDSAILEPAAWQSEVSEVERLSEMVELVELCEFKNQVKLAERLDMSTSQLSKLKQRAVYKHQLITLQAWDACFKIANSGDTEGAEGDEF